MILCDCIQGTEENGWHETVGPLCYEREMEKWRKLGHFLDSDEYKEFVERLRDEAESISSEGGPCFRS